MVPAELRLQRDVVSSANFLGDASGFDRTGKCDRITGAHQFASGLFATAHNLQKLGALRCRCEKFGRSPRDARPRNRRFPDDGISVKQCRDDFADRYRQRIIERRNQRDDSERLAAITGFLRKMILAEIDLLVEGALKTNTGGEPLAPSAARDGGPD